MGKSQIAKGKTDATRTSTAELMGRQSVRATFRLSDACINAISILATHLGIKQKSVFDHLMENAQSLNEVAKRIEDVPFSLSPRTQKTFVISRRSLVHLEKISNDYNLSRDALIEYAVHQLLPVIAKEREKHEYRKKLLNQIGHHFKEGRALLEQAEAILGGDDPLTMRFGSVMTGYQGVFEDLKTFIKRGRRIEMFESDALTRGGTPEDRDGG